MYKRQPSSRAEAGSASDGTPDAETASARDDGASGAADAPLTLSPDLSTQRTPKAAPASGASSAQ
ncbi:hypothetical protein DIS09_26990 [Burkholderia pseudomallei]|nr:hypothetical protein DIS09_26990 [Burkholderia pseudomallei]